MKKSSVVNYYYMFICEILDLNISYKEGYDLLCNILNGNKNIKSKYLKGNFKALSDILLSNDILDTNEKDIILNNLLKEFFFMIQYRNESDNKEAKYIDRDKAKQKYICKEFLIRVLISYLAHGKNLKLEYKSFVSDYKNYFTNVEMIADIMDSNDDEEKQLLKSVLQQRKESADKLIEKYKSLDISNIDLRSILEDELFWMKYEPLTGKELAAFNII